MNAAAALNDAVWLEIRKDERHWRFILDPEADRAIVVGSHQTADVSFSGAKVAPLHVHFERAEKEIWLVPAYGASVRVNAAGVRGPCKIPERATIELGRVRLDVRWGMLEAPRSSYPPPSSAVLEDVETTVMKLPSATDSIVPTGSIECSESSQPGGLRTEESALDDAGRALSDPAIAPPLPILTMTTPYGDFSSGEQAALPIDANATVALSLCPPSPEPAWESSGIPESETPLPSTGKARAGDAAWSAPKLTSGNAEAPMQRSDDVRNRSVPLHWLERLGCFGKRRPLLAAVCVVGAALVLILALFGARALAEVEGERALAVKGSLDPSSPAAAQTNAAPIDSPSTSAAPTSEPSQPAPRPSRGEKPSEKNASDVTKPGDSDTKLTAEVAVAVNHLRAGRHVEARAAYLELASKEPSNAAYAAAARMLSLRLKDQCPKAGGSALCPEIRP